MLSMPRVVLAGLSGGSGKTMISAGLARAIARRGHKVQIFKKGPDYIDTLWLSLAAGCRPRNLDPRMARPDLLPHFFEQACVAGRNAPDFALIEGNRGLFDGQDLAGSSSTAEVARRLRAPVLLCMNCAKMTRTAAAVVMGLKNFESGVDLAGVILNRASRPRHRDLLRRAVEELAGVKVYGLVPQCSAAFAERHSGLCAGEAVAAGGEALERLDIIADLIEKYVDLEAVLALARSAPPLEVQTRPDGWGRSPEVPAWRPRIGYVRDAALWFYYSENLEALEAAGARLTRLSLLGDEPWPELDGLYLGGGFPGDFAGRLAEGRARKAEVAALVEAGLPVYAEGAGFYYLARSLCVDGFSYPMAGVFDFDLRLGRTPRGLGYVRAVVERENPFHPVGSLLEAHEFHYAGLDPAGALSGESILALHRGAGLFQAGERPGRDGLLRRNCFISHMQIYAPGVPHWASRFVKAAEEHARRRERL